MATLNGSLQFTGTLGDVTGYKLPGSDKIHLRTKGGVSKERLQTDPSFELTRKNASEFGGCGKAVALLRQAVLPVIHLKQKGFKMTNAAFKIIKFIQKSDITGEKGKRAIRFSEYKSYLKGFNLHGKYNTGDLHGYSHFADINRSTGTATVTIPAMEDRMWPYKQLQQPMYRFIIHLGVLPDLEYINEQYQAPPKPDLPYATTVYTPWRYTRQNYAAEQFMLQLEKMDLLQSNMTILLSIGIEMGTPISETIVQATPGAGCAQVLLAA